MLFKKILVTGCGGDIGFGIGRLLKKMNVVENVIGCDIHDDHPGRSIFEKCYVVEEIGPAYIESMMHVVEKEKIDLIIPASELEIRHLYQQRFYGKKELFLTANEKSLEIGFDKLSTVKMLEGAGLPYPWTQEVKCGNPERVPCIIKARDGRGSKDIFIVREYSEVQDFASKYPEAIWQEYLEPEDEEYTCGIYGCRNGELRTIIMKRKLVGGCTGSGVCLYNQEIDQLLKQVADALELNGSINVQLRLTKKGPVIFEINPRFSSTVIFRSLMGFQDLLWSLQARAGKQEDSYICESVGIKFYRVYNEVIFDCK